MNKKYTDFVSELNKLCNEYQVVLSAGEAEAEGLLIVEDSPCDIDYDLCCPNNKIMFIREA